MLQKVNSARSLHPADVNSAPALSVPDNNLLYVPEWLRLYVLDAYKEECIYLRNVYRDKANRQELVTFGTFSVPESFYCKKTGHFNAVEAMICFNQLALISLADFMMDYSDHAFNTYYSKNQLSSFKNRLASETYIASMTSRFSRLITGSSITGNLIITKVRTRQGKLFLAGHYWFNDAIGNRRATPCFSGECIFVTPQL